MTATGGMMPAHDCWDYGEGHRQGYMEGFAAGRAEAAALKAAFDAAPVMWMTPWNQLLGEIGEKYHRGLGTPLHAVHLVPDPVPGEPKET